MRKQAEEERNKIQERIKEAKKRFKKMCAAEILAWEEIDATLVAQGVPKSKRPSKAVIRMYARSRGSV